MRPHAGARCRREGRCAARVFSLAVSALLWPAAARGLSATPPGGSEVPLRCSVIFLFVYVAFVCCEEGALDAPERRAGFGSRSAAAAVALLGSFC